MAGYEWQPPTRYKFKTEDERTQLVNDLRISHVSDALHQIADDLYELHHPSKMFDDDFRDTYTNDITAQGATYGEHFFYPLTDALVQFPHEEDYYALRTSRNRNLITAEEQDKLHKQRIAIFGLSVGREVLESMAQAGIGNEYMLFDPDVLSISNLNRIRGDMADVGKKKTLLAGRKLSGLDPFIVQHHFPEGYDETSDGLLRVHRPDLIIEETDNPVVKAQIRRIAAELGVPLMMTGDADERSTIAVERHDIEAVKPFTGKLSAKEFKAIAEGEMVDKDLEKLLIKILGILNLSPRLIDSAMQRNVTLTGFPQLGTTATVGGAHITTAARELFLGRDLKTGDSVHDPRKTLGLPKVTPLGRAARTLIEFAKWSRTKAKS